MSWGCYLTAAALQRTTAPGADLPLLATVLLYAGTFAPAVVALSLTARSDEAGETATLLNAVFRTDVPARWYGFALAYFPAVKLAAALMHRAALGVWPRFGDAPWYVVVAAIAISTPVQAGEEIGWRGYALPRLAARFGLPRAAIVLGVIWAVWHLPLFFIPGVDNYGQSFTLFAIAVTALSVAMAWLYVRTDASLFVVMLMHSVINQTSLSLPSGNPITTNPFVARGSFVGWATVGLLSVAAIYLLFCMRQLEFQRLRVARDQSIHS